MKRSRINRALREAEGFFAELGFVLPPFSRWAPADWAEAGPCAEELKARGLGWDVTDFGREDFDRWGLVLFTLRNRPGDGVSGGYAEKAMMVRVEQETPLHAHRVKSEDIINRGGGVLAIRIEPADDSDGVEIGRNGCRCCVAAGSIVELTPGESVSLGTNSRHAFWAIGFPVLVGEVSTYNDDASDNCFSETTMKRFPDVDEDEPPVRLLVCDYGRI